MKEDMMLKSYLRKISEIATRGDAREESYYSVLKGLLKEYSDSVGKRNIYITILPKKTEAGNPDFRVWDGTQHIVGYIEAKSPMVENLDRIENSEQLKRYRKTFPNLILTNFFEFRLYRDGTLADQVLIGRPFVAQKLKMIPPVEKQADFIKLLEKFFSFSLPKVYSAKTLAIELAKRTRFLKDEVIAQELKEEEGKGHIFGFYEAFRKYLIGTLSKEEFADLYSQTITYGLFAARTRSENGFNRKLAYDNIPHTIGILRDVFSFVSLEDLPKQMEWIIDDISEVLAVTDVNEILHTYFHEGRGKDPIVHFYETFLAEYDPKTREKRGVYYTPESVVSYIVRSLHHILKQHFDKREGFAISSVTVLDPAAGTLTFLAEAAKQAVEEFVFKYGEGGEGNFIKEHILKNFYAFELMMAPYAVGYLKMSFLLEELGYRLKEDDRFKLYLTNTLEMEELAETGLPFMASLSEESHLAGKVKKEQPILVILGNPPYSGHSANASERYITIKTKKGIAKRRKIKTWIGKLIGDYKFVDGKPLGEKNPKWLQDDYVKFIRFAQWKIDQAGEGVLGYITNHSYLDNPTFRGMRQSVMNSFNEIYILDLHGNSLKKEKSPDGSKDENVFDIQQGVAIALCIKNQEKKSECKVYHSEIWGMRENKYEWLLENNVETIEWNQLSPKSEFYLFVPRDERLLEYYERWPKITEIFPLNSVGVVTSRDKFVIDSDKEKLKQRIRTFCDKNMPDGLVRQTFELKDKSNWKLEAAREEVRKDKKWGDSITKILYRPFDIRWIFYHDAVIERSRKKVMRHMMQGNIGLVFMRQVALNETYSHVFISQNIIDNRSFYSNRGIMSLAPLYLYPYTDRKELIGHMEKAEKRQPNINPKIFKALSDICKSAGPAVGPVGRTFLSDTNLEETDKNVCSTLEETDKNVCSTNDLQITRRHLPHWTLKDATYFVTFRTAQGDLSIEEQKLVLKHIIEGNGKFYTLIAAIVMPDHVHLLLTPKEEYNLSRIMRGIKGASARQLNLKRGTSGSIWQEESFDRIIRDQNELNEKMNYMLNNPVKRALTESPWGYHGWYFNGETDREETDKNVCSTNITPEEIFYYIYAILYSNIYRTQYAEFLKGGFPRIPFTRDCKIFNRMAEYGKELVDLHLLRSQELDPPLAKFQGSGDEKVEKLRYDEKQECIYINQNQYFEGIPKDCWEYQIGGYQVCSKWLKDRKDKVLSLEDIKHYCKVVTSLKKTIEVQKAIDKVYPEVEKETINLDLE
ncbi:MAG: type ISP restriction/modification enzyme [Thermodesulfobacteriota bacterium]|nr:type ISP restriction/modification enzyme [Thermodesulfobacteriota bacterium]